MKQISATLLAIGVMLSGCSGYDTPNRNDGQYRNDRGAENRVERPGEFRNEREREGDNRDRSGDRQDNR